MLNPEKLSKVVKEIIAEKGAPWLFGLFLREEAEDRWDLVVAAPWVKGKHEEAFRYLADKTKSKFRATDLVTLAGIVLMEPPNPVLDAVWGAVEVAPGNKAEIANCSFNGLEIKKAFLFASLRPERVEELKKQAEQGSTSGRSS